MKLRRGLFGVRYRRDFEGNAQDTRVEIEFDRSKTKGISAVGSFVTLPAPFNLHWVSSLATREPAALDFSRNGPEARYVVWDLADADSFEVGDVLRYTVTGECIETFDGTIDWEAGEDSLLLTGVLQDRAAPADGQTCSLEVDLRLSRDGSVDPAFQGGFFVGEQLRSLTLLARP
ncbi:MAG: hypothetical protein AB8G23_15090 [Myxococcota bacterium]